MQYGYLVIFLSIITNTALAELFSFPCKTYLESSSEPYECLKETPYVGNIYLISRGKANSNVLQGIALHGQTLFTLNTIHKGEKEAGVVTRFSFDPTSRRLTSIDRQLPSNLVGHQGITFDNQSGYILTSAGKKTKDYGRYISYFKYSPNKTPNTKIMKVFNEDYKSKLNTMPIATNKYIIIRGMRNNKNILRVYKKNLFWCCSSDVNSYHEFSVSDKIISDKKDLQAIASDDKNIFILSGTPDQKNKSLYIYKINGEFHSSYSNISLGKNDSFDIGFTQHWEPEGLAVDFKNMTLLFAFTFGDPKQRLSALYPIKLNE